MRFIIKLIRQLIVAVTFFLVMTYSLSFPAQEQHTYTEMTGNRKDSFVWKLNQFGNGVEIEASGGREKLINRCDPSGMTREWIVTTPEQSVRVEREGNTLIFSGIDQGQHIDKIVAIDESPWFQPLSFSLRKFIDSPQESILFWHIRSDNLEPVKLAAVKVGLSSEDVCDGQKGYFVEIRPAGLFAPLWQASLWFRSGDNVFCRYESRHGIWGTPRTVIFLDKK